MAFLKLLHRLCRNCQLHIIVDKLAIHKAKEVKQWLKGGRKITLHFTPTYSSWLYQVEIFFNILIKDVQKNGVWTCEQQLVVQLIKYIRTYTHKRAAPFQWTYTGQPLAIWSMNYVVATLDGRPAQGICSCRMFVGTVPPMLIRIGSRSLAVPVYFAVPSMVTSPPK